jgi:hypothetical protein
MACFQYLHLEDAKRDADLKVLQFAPNSPDFLYWLVQSAHFRNMIEAHRRCCDLCSEDSWPLASSF